MYSEVPQPITSARSPLPGRASATSVASARARGQRSGWLAISCSIALISGDCIAQSCRIQCQMRSFAGTLAPVRHSERVSRIVERLSADGSVGVAEMAVELDVSPAPVRRDLILMEEQRLLARTHGGAVAEGVLYELPLRYRGARRHE